jgi:hypothetical protein
MRRLHRRISLVTAALIVGWLLFAAAGVPVWNSLETRRSAQRNSPPILISPANLPLMGFADATRIGLRDGRVFRLAHVVAPDGGTPEHARAAEHVQTVLASGANRQVGLKPIGTSPDGETLVELWGFHSLLGGCGNMSWTERRRAKIPHWKSLTWQLVGGGHFALEPGVPDAEAVGFERVAREKGEGIWSKRRYLQRFANLSAYEAVLGSAKEKHTLWDHRTAAMILLRADPEKYVPQLLAIVKDASRDDSHFRSMLAIALDESGHAEGTAYLMDALRGAVHAGLDEHGLNGVVGNYISYWNVGGRVPDGDDVSMVAYYDSTIRPEVRR